MPTLVGPHSLERDSLIVAGLRVPVNNGGFFLKFPNGVFPSSFVRAGQTTEGLDLEVSSSKYWSLSGRPETCRTGLSEPGWWWVLDSLGVPRIMSSFALVFSLFPLPERIVPVASRLSDVVQGRINDAARQDLREHLQVRVGGAVLVTQLTSASFAGTAFS